MIYTYFSNTTIKLGSASIPKPEGECGYDTASRYISLFIFLISCKFLADLKHFFLTL